MLQVLTKPNGMTLTQTYEATHNLLTGMDYHRGSTLVAQRTYTYDLLGRPTARNTARQGSIVNDTFVHNTRSELVEANVNSKEFEYTFDNIGNRQASIEDNNAKMYNTNELNQYSAISENGDSAFVPQFDADGNQTLIKTSTGIWSTVYNAENRPVSFMNNESNTVVECAYDSMGRRVFKKVISGNGTVTSHQRFIYRGYLQIACVDLTRTNHPALWLITWDPTQAIATRPLAIQKDGTWYSYGLDLTKNVCEVFGPAGNIRTAYTYSPYGQVTASGNVTQPIQWSSEFHDEELGLVYYNWRYYSSRDGRWINRDFINELLSKCLYIYCNNSSSVDYLGLQFVTPDLVDRVPGSLNSENHEMIIEFGKSWKIAITNFLYWLSSNYESHTVYKEGSYESNQVKNSVIGKTIRNFFIEKNINAEYCEDWRGVDNYALKFPGWDTLKYMFGDENQRNIAFKHIERFASGINSGIVSFIGSSNSVVEIKIVESERKKYILANYKVFNTTSLKSFIYHIIPDEWNGKEWTQEYQWTELFPCCPITADEIQRRKTIMEINEMTKQMFNSFPYNLHEVEINIQSNPFFVPGF